MEDAAGRGAPNRPSVGDDGSGDLAQPPFAAPTGSGPLPGLAGFGRMAGPGGMAGIGGPAPQQPPPPLQASQMPPAQAPQPPLPRSGYGHPAQQPTDFEPTRPGPRVLTRDDPPSREEGEMGREDALFGHDEGLDYRDDGPPVGGSFASELPEELQRYLTPDDEDVDAGAPDADPISVDEDMFASDDFASVDEGEAMPSAFGEYDDYSIGEGEEATAAAFPEPEYLDYASEADPLDLGRESVIVEGPGAYGSADRSERSYEDAGSDAAFAHGAGNGRFGHDELGHDELGRDELGHDGLGHDGLRDADFAGRDMQPFEARYDQHPEIPIGAFPAGQGDDGLDHAFHAQGGSDAEFLDRGLGGDDDDDIRPPRKGRKTLVLASGVVGALALGGALAFAYKTGGDSASVAGQPPLVQADAEPVKEAPDEPGGREFPHRNKEIYERLQGEERIEQARLMPREEEVAPRIPQDPAGPSRPGGTSERADADAAGGSADATGPRRVRTFVVRPDGSVVQPSDAPAAAQQQPTQDPQAEPSVPGMSITTSQIQQAGQQQQAQLQQQPAPQAAQQPSPSASPSAAPQPPALPTGAAQQPAQPSAEREVEQQLAARTTPEAEGVGVPTRRPDPPAQATQSQPTQQPQPQQGTASAPSGAFVVQVAAHKSQTEALAAFADLQQRYPNHLSGYRPIIERADLGERGVWYRLRVGPMETRQVAGTLCDELKSAGLQSCLVYAQ